VNERTRRLVLTIALLALLLGLFALVLRQTFTSRVHGGNDLYPRWVAGCAWLGAGQNPYSSETTVQIQKGIYGRPAWPDEDQVAFAYPVYAVLLTWPLCLANDFATALAVAMTALGVCLVLTAIFARRVAGWSTGGWLWLWTLAWIIVMYPSARGLLLGQLAMVVALLQVGALEALRRRRDEVAGVALAISTLKPQMALLIVPMLLFWSAAQRRWRVPAAFGVALALLVIVPLIWLPSWPSAWLAQVAQYRSYTEFGSVTWVLTTYYLGTPPALEMLATAALLGWFLIELWRGRRDSFEPMLWLAALAIVLTHFVSPRTATTQFGPLLVLLFMLFRLLENRNEGRGRQVIAIVMPLLAVVSWLVFSVTVEGRQESAVNFVPIPLALLLAVVWMRRAWFRLTQPAG
jgi:hypothetical protein